jgi:pimeloyl-ACP methyl ester carboxylesterase
VAGKAMVIRCRGAQLAAVLTRPGGGCRAAVALLHPADDPSGRQFLFQHLAMVLPEQGIAVLRYDRRAWPPGRDVPYALQAEDLGHGLHALAGEAGCVPAGLWGFSQGAWVALMTAAARADIAFLVLVGCSAVSPACQMRYGTAGQLRRAGFGPACIAELGELRAAYEGYQRGQLSRQQAQQVVDAFASRPWFELSWVPRMLPATPDWDDMDFDPAPVIGQLRCPVLAFYGTDEWVPVQESISIWRATFPDPAQLTIHQLTGTTHHPTLGGRRELPAISPEYTAKLTSWLEQVITRTAN